MTNDKKATGRVASVCSKVKRHFTIFPPELTCIVAADIGVAVMLVLAWAGYLE